MIRDLKDSKHFSRFNNLVSFYMFTEEFHFGLYPSNITLLHTKLKWSFTDFLSISSRYKKYVHDRKQKPH
jgi:hypothetical protein